MGKSRRKESVKGFAQLLQKLLDLKQTLIEHKNMKSLFEEIENTRQNIKVGAKCKVLFNGVVKHRGIVTKYTTIGTFIFNNMKDSSNNDANSETAEFYAFANRVDGQGGIVLI